MSEPPGRPGAPEPGRPPDYPYGTPHDESLLWEPGTRRPYPMPQAWTPPPPPPGYTVVSPESVTVRTRAVVALIVSILLTVPCFDLVVIPAIVTSAIAVNRSRSDVPLARALVRVSWVWIAVSLVLALAFVVYALTTGSPTPTPSPSAR